MPPPPPAPPVQGDRPLWDARVAAGPLTRIGWLLQLARQLHVGHRAGSVHGRVSPDALRLSRTGAVKLLHPDKLKSVPAGQCPYQAPERFENATLHPRLDVYAWGAIAFDLLEDRPPLSPEDAAALFRGETNTPTKAPNIRKKAGRDLERLVIQCLQWDREDRPRDIQEVETRLIQIVQDLRKAHKGLPSPLRPRNDPMKIWMGLSVAAFVPLVYLGYLFLGMQMPEPDFQVQADYGEIQVWAAPLKTPEGARYRLRKGQKTIGVLPAPSPGTKFSFPTEGQGPYEVELVDGDEVLSTRIVTSIPTLPKIAVSASEDTLEIQLAENLIRELQLRVQPPEGKPQNIPMLEGQDRLRVAWNGKTGVYRVELRDPKTDRLLSDRVGLLE